MLTSIFERVLSAALFEQVELYFTFCSITETAVAFFNYIFSTSAYSCGMMHFKWTAGVMTLSVLWNINVFYVGSKAISSFWGCERPHLLNICLDFNQSICSGGMTTLYHVVYIERPLEPISSHAERFWLIAEEGPEKTAGEMLETERESQQQSASLCQLGLFHVEKILTELDRWMWGIRGRENEVKKKKSQQEVEERARISQSQTLSIKHHSSIAHFMFALAACETCMKALDMKPRSKETLKLTSERGPYGFYRQNIQSEGDQTHANYKGDPFLS